MLSVSVIVIVVSTGLVFPEFNLESVEYSILTSPFSHNIISEPRVNEMKYILAWIWRLLCSEPVWLVPYVQLLRTICCTLH
jgi:hypothetical protein